MTETMLKFVSRDRETPQKRSPDDRRDDFGEIYATFAAERAAEQASRCSQCGVPFCQDHCPLHNNIPDWLRLVAEGDLKSAYALSSSTNAMPEVCGRICPQDRLCEGSCVIEQSGHGTVTIGAVETYITEKAWAEGWVPAITPAEERAQSVGIVGAGPGGLVAAEKLREQGFKVTVYDRYDRAGGLLVYGIPGFKLEKHVVTRRFERLAEGGVEFKLGWSLGRDGSLAELRAKHDAVLIACGVYAARELDAPVGASSGVVAALDYLTVSNRKNFGDAVPAFDDGSLNADGKRVVVIGGGDTAMDCVRTAVRQGAKSVTCLYRRDRANMPGSAREVANAEEEGVVFEWLAGPKAVLADANGAASAVRAVRMRLGEPDASGRRAPEETPGSEFDIPADIVVKALGFEPEDGAALFGDEAPALTTRGTVRVEPRTLETSLPGVFAAGDIVRGASLVVWAVRDGQVAAHAIAERLISSAGAKALAAE